ncbi:MAG: VTT domain-containing protein [Fusobacteria bacterium]|nr:VTT domain-containing protein [Fusobacteriota bacterium]
MKKYLKFIPIVLIIIVIIFMLHEHVLDYLSIKYIATHRDKILNFSHAHLFQAIFLYCFLCIVTIACGLPVLVIFNLLAGFLFGAWFGSLLATVCATVGATLLYLAIKLVFGEWAEKKFAGKMPNITHDIEDNALLYLIILRFIPILPFEVTTVLAAVLNIPIRIFFTSTLIGILPGTIIWVCIGAHLGKIAKSDSIDIKDFMSPAIFIPLLLLLIFAILPIIYKKIGSKKKKK